MQKGIRTQFSRFLRVLNKISDPQLIVQYISTVNALLMARDEFDGLCDALDLSLETFGWTSLGVAIAAFTKGIGRRIWNIDIDGQLTRSTSWPGDCFCDACDRRIAALNRSPQERVVASTSARLDQDTHPIWHFVHFDANIRAPIDSDSHQSESCVTDWRKKSLIIIFLKYQSSPRCSYLSTRASRALTRSLFQRSKCCTKTTAICPANPYSSISCSDLLHFYTIELWRLKHDQTIGPYWHRNRAFA